MTVILMQRWKIKQNFYLNNDHFGQRKKVIDKKYSFMNLVMHITYWNLVVRILFFLHISIAYKVFSCKKGLNWHGFDLKLGLFT